MSSRRSRRQNAGRAPSDDEDEPAAVQPNRPPRRRPTRSGSDDDTATRQRHSRRRVEEEEEEEEEEEGEEGEEVDEISEHDSGSPEPPPSRRHGSRRGNPEPMGRRHSSNNQRRSRTTTRSEDESDGESDYDGGADLQEAIRASEREAARAGRRVAAGEVDETELARVIRESEEAHTKAERARARREERVAAEMARRLADVQRESEAEHTRIEERRRLESDVDADLERVLKESAAEAKREQRAREERERLIAEFGSSSGSRRHTSPDFPDHNRSQSSRTTERSSASGRERPRLAPISTAAPARTVSASSTRDGTSSRIASPSPVASPEEIRSPSRRLIGSIRDTLDLVRRPSSRNTSRETRTPPSPMSPGPSTPRPQRRGFPTPGPEFPRYRDRGASPLLRSQTSRDTPMRRATSNDSSTRPRSSTSGTSRARPSRRRPFDEQPPPEHVEAALHASRLAILATAPENSPQYLRAMAELDGGGPPVDEDDGLEENFRPPSYADIGQHKILDATKWTTTSTKSNEPGRKRRITRDDLTEMKKALEDTGGKEEHERWLRKHGVKIPGSGAIAAAQTAASASAPDLTVVVKQNGEGTEEEVLLSRADVERRNRARERTPRRRNKEETEAERWARRGAREDGRRLNETFSRIPQVSERRRRERSGL